MPSLSGWLPDDIEITIIVANQAKDVYKYNEIKRKLLNSICVVPWVCSVRQPDEYPWGRNV
jgi:hypothetical protein